MILHHAFAVAMIRSPRPSPPMLQLSSADGAILLLPLFQLLVCRSYSRTRNHVGRPTAPVMIPPLHEDGFRHDRRRSVRPFPPSAAGRRAMVISSYRHRRLLLPNANISRKSTCHRERTRIAPVCWAEGLGLSILYTHITQQPFACPTVTVVA